MVQSYKQHPKLSDKYDVILIGSGMGCLTAAAMLAKEGKKCLLLERHYTPGGFTHVFKRRGYEWDVGIHYIGDVARPNSVIKKLFDYVSDGNLKWADMGEVYDRVIIGQKKYDFVKGVENFKNKLKEYFPDEIAAIDQYVDKVFEANKTMGKFYMDKALPKLLSKTLGSFIRKAHYKNSDQTTYSVLRSLTNNEELIKVLSAQYGDYGLPPKKSSFSMHASVARHYFNGGYFPVGGSSQIVNTIDPVIERAGGTILISAEVKEVIVEKNKATGVEMADGHKFYAEKIISGTGIVNSFNKLMPKAIALQHGLKDILSTITPSVSHSCLYIGFNGSPEELKLPKTNLWIYPKEGDHDSCVENYLEDMNAEFPVVYVSFPSAKDPDWSNRYPGKSTIDIITLVPYKTFSHWEGSRWMKRGDEYEKLKEKIANRLLDVLFEQLPHLKEHLDYYELSTPLTTAHFLNYSKGEIYGIDHSPKRFRQKHLTPQTAVKNFYLTGQDIVTAGVGGAMFSGLLTASAMTGKNLMKRLFD